MKDWKMYVIPCNTGKRNKVILPLKNAHLKKETQRT